jgi:serine/threonine protein kinase
LEKIPFPRNAIAKNFVGPGATSPERLLSFEPSTVFKAQELTLDPTRNAATMIQTHPDQQQLRAYAIGQLSDDQVLELESHLANCQECEETLDSLPVADATLLDGLRRPRPDDPVLREPRLTSALARIAALIDTPGPTGSLAASVAVADAATDLGTIGVYRLLAELGEGGMGKVYQALHTKLKRIVALKVLPSVRLRNPHAISRFEREMEAVGRLDHPHIVRAIDAGEADGAHFLVMEYVAGWDLSTLSRHCGPLPVAEACELVRQAAVGLQFAHEQGLVHRDIKPANLMLAVGQAAGSPPSELHSSRQLSHTAAMLSASPTVKILDLGLARLADLQDDGEGLASIGQIMGTLDYMAPEQAGDSHTVDIRADIYSLGATLYKLLTGHSIYHGEPLQTTIQKLSVLATRPAPPIQSRRADISDELAAIIHRLLEKDPQRRFATPAEVAAVLAPHAAAADLKKLARRMSSDEQSQAAVDHSSLRTHESVKSGSVDTDPRVVSVPQPSGNTPTSDLPQARVAALQSAEAVNGRKNSLAGGPARRRTRGVLIALAGAAAILLAGVVFYFQTNHGTLVVELDDPQGELRVAVEGQDVVISDQQKPAELIRLRAGEHKLRVTRGDLSFESDGFTIKRGERLALNVKLVPGEIRILQGDKVLGTGRLPAADPADSPEAPEATTPPNMVARAASAKAAAGGTSDAGPSPWDSLDPSGIPEAERIPQLPPETVAVFGSHRQRDWGEVRAIAIRPDGKQAATAGNGIRFWDLETFRETAWLNYREHNVSGVRSLVYTPDGQRLIAAGGTFITVIDCRAESPSVIAKLPITGFRRLDLSSLDISPSGNWLSGINIYTNQAILWQLNDNALTLGPQFDELASYQSPVVFSPDGERICVSNRVDGTVQLHGFNDGELTAGPVITGSSEERDDVPVAPLREARFAPDGRLAIADGKRRMWLYDVSGDEPRPLFQLDRSAVTCQFSSDGRTLITHPGSSTYYFSVWALRP